MLRRRLHAEWALVAMLSCLFVASAAFWGWFSAVDNRIYDLASGLAAPAADERILLVEIDDASLRQIGRWPWSRDIHARALDVMARARPAAIAYDVLFLDQSPDDDRLSAALAKAGPVYIPALLETGHAGMDQLAAPVEPIAGAAKTVGVAQILADNDGIVRWAERGLTVNGQRAAQLPTLLASQVQPAVHGGASFGDRFLIAYAGKHAFRRISFASVANGEVPASLLAGKLVIVGATAPGMGDIHAVPMAAGSLLSGPEVQANILNTLLGGTAVATLRPGSMALVALVPLLLLLAAFRQLSPGRNLMLAAVLVAGSLLLAVILLPVARIWLPPTATVAGLVLVHALWGWRRLTAINGFLVAQAEGLLQEPGVIAPGQGAGLARDVVETEAMRLEAVIGQVRRLRTFIGRVIERFPDAVFVVDSQDQVVQANAAAVRLIGRDVGNQPIAQVIAEIVQEPALAGVPIRHASGRSLLMATAPIDDSHRIVSFADITELQRAADERDELLQFLSHDLRSPNAAIVWLLEAQGAETALPESALLQPGLRDQLRAHARHGLRLADNFVQLVRARRRALAQEPVDLCDVAREAADMVAAHARKRGVHLHNDSDVGELWVMGDHAMLVRAAINLLENAVKFATENAAVEFGVKQQGGFATLLVAGPGPDMPAGRQANPFALYAEGRSADGKPSLGLGLAFVQTTAQRHHGAALYAYRPSYGAEFRIRLPLALFDDG